MELSSESNAEQEAKRLEKILLKGIETNSPEVISFLAREFYPSYLIVSEDTFGAYEIPLEIRKVYEN